MLYIFVGDNRNKSRSGSGKSGSKLMDNVITSTQLSQREKEIESTQRTLVALNDMKIKFPGKTDDEAEIILDKVLRVKRKTQYFAIKILKMLNSYHHHVLSSVAIYTYPR